MANDPVIARTITERIAHWGDIEVHYRGEINRSSGHGFIGIGRKVLLDILSNRDEELGVVLHYEPEFGPELAGWDGYALVITDDGVNSRVRDSYAAHFGAEIQTSHTQL